MMLKTTAFWGIVRVSDGHLLTATSRGATSPLLYETRAQAEQSEQWIDEQPGQWKIVEFTLVPVET